MKGEDKIASPAPSDSWTRPEAYVSALARRRSYRKAREDKPRTQPAGTQPWLSTIPFIAILLVLGILAAAIIFIAFPGRQPVQGPKQAPVHEPGVAAPGWYQKALKEMHR